MKIIFRLFLATLFVSCSVANAASFKIASVDVKAQKKIDEKHVFNGFGCSGENLSPQISWSNAPKDTKSFAVTVYDPDAPTGSGWWHWLVLNIPLTKKELPANFGAANKFNIQDGMVQIRNDFGVFNFGGPCPPKGDKSHRYVFTVYALKIDKIDISKDATAALAGFMINQNTLAKAHFTALYGR
jgi:hypothetical protein